LLLSSSRTLPTITSPAPGTGDLTPEELHDGSATIFKANGFRPNSSISSATFVALQRACWVNPISLENRRETIVELFGGEIPPFLEAGEVIVGSVRELLSKQFDRLSAVEQTVLLWLAILREPMSIREVLALLGTPIPRGQVLEAWSVAPPLAA